MTYTIEHLQEMANRCPLQRGVYFGELDHGLEVHRESAGNVSVRQVWLEIAGVGLSRMDCVLFYGDAQFAHSFLTALLPDTQEAP